MKATELRQSILQAAVQGKLAPQNSDDEPAPELLKRIQEQRTQLVKKGRIKREKPLPPVTKDDIPYDLPEGWSWCRIGDLGSVQSSKRVFTSEFVNSGIPFYRGTEIGALSSGRKIVPQYYITEKHYRSLIQHTGKPMIGDLLMPSICPDGRIWLVNTEEPFYFKDGRVLWVHFIENCVNNHYIHLALKARLLSDYANIASGTTFAELKIFLLKEVAIPLPPLAEQNRIVSKVDELMSLCDELEAEEKKLDALETNFSEFLPKTILQAAVQGNLVPQSGHEEPASELLKRIQKKKDKLVKEGKIPKRKPLSPITEDEIPYNLPEGWVWARLTDIATINPRNCLPDGTVVSFLPMNLISQDYFGGHQQETRLWSTVKKGFTHFAENDILIAKITPCFQNGKSCIARDLNSGYGAGTTELHVLRTIEMFPQYLLVFVKSPRFLETCTKNMTGTAGQQRVPTEYLMNYLVPLPPLAEQQRIVGKVDELMALCNELKSAYTTPVELPELKNIIQFPTVEPVEETLLAARGNVGQLSNEAMQAIDDLFAEDEE